MNTALTRPICRALWLALPLWASAQMLPAPDALPTPPTSLTAGQAPPEAPVDAASQPALMPLVPVSAPATAPVLEGCRALTDKAMAADMKAVTAQAQKADLNEQDRLFEASIQHWTLALAQCDGRAKERAGRNLADNQKTRASLSEQLDSGPQCAAAHKDAAALQDLARQAMSERRWDDAAMLFRKAENMWDTASERCTGSQQEAANRRREQSEIDGQNAVGCAPLFDKAREQTQKFRAAAGGLSREEKLDASLVSETLWREATSQCKGAAAQDPARNNAQALARERGTPWVARVAPASLPVVALKKPETVIATAATLSQMSGKGAGTTGAVSALATAVAPIATPVQAPVSAPVLAPVTAPVAAAEFSADTTRFSGQFVRDANAATYSGTGKVVWASGDVFEGTMVKGLRHGKGLFVWANGHRYNGDWVNDTPTGQASVQFANGNQFDGSVIAGEPQGEGRMRYASGDTYAGQFKAGEPEGRGVYLWKNGQQFDGDWKKGSPNGQGKLKFAAGNLFEGHVLDGVPNGAGNMRFATGETYVGHYVNGLPDGQGRFQWTHGDVYNGQWKAGKKHGQGTFTWKSGDLWEGVYDNDVQTAQAPSAVKN